MIEKRFKFLVGDMIRRLMVVFGPLTQRRDTDEVVFLISMKGLGDSVLATAVLAPIKKQHPGKRIVFVTKNSTAGSIVSANPNVERVHILNYEKKGYLAEYLRLCRDFRPRFALALQPSYINAFFAVLARSPNTVWFMSPDNMVEQIEGKQRCLDTSRCSLIEYSCRAVRMLAKVWDPKPEIYISKKNRIQLPWPKKDTIAVFPGGGKDWKRWDVRKFSELTHKLSKEFNVAVCGGDLDKHLLDAIDSGGGKSPNLRYVVTDNIQQLASVIGGVRLLISNDSVPVHTAAAVLTPAIVIFGPTSHTHILPNLDDFTVVSANMPCQPCYSLKFGKTECTVSNQSLCLESISVEDVLEIVRSRLASEQDPTLKFCHIKA
jgi:ADP-heptose:LPS heptosyltransferase